MPLTDTLWSLPPEYMEQLIAAHSSEQRADETAWGNFSPDGSGREKGYTITRTVAVIPVTGTLYRDSQDAIRQAVASALADPNVRAILLDVNSPGGVVAGTKELADFVAEARTTKPCAAYADGLCASAAYWLAAATGRVFAPITASVGSIGILSVLCNTAKMNEKWGISYTYITGGKWKAAGNGDTPLTDEERRYFQERVSALHAIFKADVARHLNLSADPAAWGEAQVLLAQPALALGLVTDIVRDVDSAITKLAVEAHMTREDLLKTAPDVAEALLAEGALRAEAANREATAKAATEAVTGMLHVVKAVVGDEAYAKVETILSTCKAANMDAAQIAAIAPMLVQTAHIPQADALANPEAQSRAAILAELQNAHQPPVAATPGATVSFTAKSPLLADAERRAKTA